MHDPAHLTNPSMNKRLPKTPSVSVDILDEYSALSNSSEHGAETSKEKSKSWRGLRNGPKHHWKPCTQTMPFLLAVILASAALIALLELVLSRSNRDSGILFASNINDLALSSSFSYLYLPTIIALVWSFTWTWIDVDTKRLQPFLQLSRDEGARGDDSLLLHYPFDFVAFVPFKAMRRRHWPVFAASFAVVVIFWGLTPLQSSIFATKTITKTDALVTATSTTYLSIKDQNTVLTGSYAQSVYNIAWLNETLPSFMSPQTMLAPFGFVKKSNVIQTAETWTGQTRAYSVDLVCQSAISERGSMLSYNGCNYDEDNFPPPEQIQPDQYTSLFVGYWDAAYSGDWYLQSSCPTSANQTLFVQWSRGINNTNTTVPKPIAATALFCESNYYQQDVNATVSPPHMSVVDIVPTGPKLPLPRDLLNVTDYEMGLSGGQQRFQNRGEYPTSQWPDSTERLAYLNLTWSDGFVPYMAAFAIAASQLQASDYMNQTLLAESYQAAYRLLFARRLVDILSNDIDLRNQSIGYKNYETESVVLVPTFVYIVEALLVATAVFAAVLLYLSLTTPSNLSFDPANLASVMALASDDQKFIRGMRPRDRSTTSDLKAYLEAKRFALLPADGDGTPSGHGYILKVADYGPSLDGPAQHCSESSMPAKTILPKELSGIFGAAFLVFQVTVVVVIVYTFVRAGAENGLPLPSSSIFVNQLVENYVPMVLAAFYEPVWTVLTRIICMLQPFEQLRKGNTPAARSLTVDYNSLPPQAVIWRALRAGHVPLAVVCLMSLLANVLSVSFSSLLFENAVPVARSANYNRPYMFPLDGTTLGNASFAAYQPVYDQFYVAMSNLTAGTPLPPWTDEIFFYLPFNGFEATDNTQNQYRAATQTLRASLDCIGVSTSGQEDSAYKISFAQGESSVISFNANVSIDDESTCDITTTMTGTGMPVGSVALEGTKFIGTANNSICNNTVVSSWVRSQNATFHYNITTGEIDGMVGKLGPIQTSSIVCKPKILSGWRMVTVDLNGYVRSSSMLNETDDVESLFVPSLPDFIGSVHKLLGSTDQWIGPTWHNDSYPSDFFNYLMVTALKNTDILDPSMHPPTFNETAPAFSALYSKLFAIVIASNIPKVLQPETNLPFAGEIISSEARLFISKPMFILSTVILSLYIVATAAVYLRRPWKILPRMPTTVASQIAFFAASHALEDMRGTASMTVRERDTFVAGLGRKYGFGRFIGTDGKAHCGIEREPLVQILKKEELGKT